MTDEEYEAWLRDKMQQDDRPAYMKLMSQLGVAFVKGSTALLRGAVFYEQTPEGDATYDIVDGNAVPNRNAYLVNAADARQFVYPTLDWNASDVGPMSGIYHQDRYKDTTATVGATVLFWMIVAGATTALVMQYAKPKRRYVRRRRLITRRRRVGVYRRRRRRVSTLKRVRIVRRKTARRFPVRRYFKRRK